MENILPLRTETMKDLNQRFEQLLAKLAGVITYFLKHQSESKVKVEPEVENKAGPEVEPEVENKAERKINKRATNPKVTGIESNSGNPTAPLV